MKVSTNMKSGQIIENALQATESLGRQVSGIIYAAEQQAEGLTNVVINTANTLWQNLTSLIGG